jgi:MFS family permease
MSWGWRVPFIASVILIGISMYIQLHLEETEAFKELETVREAHHHDEAAAPVVKRSPVVEALSKYPKTIALAAGAFLSIQVCFYILIGFILAYGSDPGGAAMSRDQVLTAVLIASAIQIPFQTVAAAYSDRHGRRGVFMLGAVLMGIWSFVLFPLVDTGNFFLAIVGITGGLGALGMMYGPQAAFYTELFSTEVRYSGASLGYQIGAIVGGAFAPTIATILWTEYAIIWVSVYMAIASLASLLCVWRLTETSGNSLSA